MKPHQWFSFRNSADDASVVDIHIVDVIGGWDDDWIARNFGYDMGVTARAFIEQLAGLSSSVKAIKLHINSPGGDVQGGINIANALRDQQVSKGRRVVTYIDGMAASIASVIAMAGQEIHISDNALVMVHNPWSWVVGNAGEMRKTADILDTMRAQAIATYQWHSSLDADALAALMDAETWMNADEAIAKGFATHKVEGLKAAALFEAKSLGALKVPEQYRARVLDFVKPVQPTPQAAAPIDLVRACNEGGCPELAESLLASGATTAQVTTAVTETKTRKATAAQRVTQITALCEKAKQPELAAGYIKGQMAVDDVRAHLATITAKQDTVEIESGLKPDAQAPARGINRQAIYDRFNRAS